MREDLQTDPLFQYNEVPQESSAGQNFEFPTATNFGTSLVTTANEAAARTLLSAAQSGSNSDITSLNTVTGTLNLSATTSTLKIKEGSNATLGVATLVAGTVAVNNTRITANTRIFLSNQNGAGAPGTPYVSARVNGTSFTITSTSATDTGDIAYLLIEPA